MANFELIQFASADELASRVASLWLDEIELSNRAGKNHCVALSGGRITQKFFAAVVKLIREGCRVGDPNFRDGDTPSLPKNVHFFWADERCVLPTDSESNFKMANDFLLAPLKISENQIHRIRGEESPEVAAKMADEKLCSIVSDFVGERSRLGCGSTRLASNTNANDEASLAARETRALPVFDLIFLGMGEDGHVASLFPNHTEGTNPKEIFCAIQNSPKPPPNRISLSYAAIASAKEVWVLTSGVGKENALRESLSPNGKTPLAKVIQSRSRTEIYADIKI